jgi:hypothetical protein
MEIKNREGIDVNEESDFERADTVVCALGVVAAGAVAVKASAIDSSVTAAAFLRGGAEKRSPPQGRDPHEPVVDGDVTGRTRETEFGKDTGHLREEIVGFAVGFLKLDANGIDPDHGPFSEPAAA